MLKYGKCGSLRGLGGKEEILKVKWMEYVVFFNSTRILKSPQILFQNFINYYQFCYFDSGNYVAG